MAKKAPELTKSVKHRIGCKAEECLKHFTFVKVPKSKLTKNGISWEYTARCPSCPKVVTFSEAMMKNIHRCLGNVTISRVTNNFDDMFTKS